MNRWLAGNVFWPLTERLMGRDTMRRFRALTASQHWSVNELAVLRNRKLRRLLNAAGQHCPFYARRFREAGLCPDDPNLTVEDLRRLPVLERHTIREHLHEMTWIGCPGGAYPYSTGGSSGEPLRFYFDRPRQAADWAARWRARSWWNVRPGDPEILLWGAPVELKTQDRLKACRDRLLNQLLLSAFDLTAERMDACIAAFQRRRPICVYGYPSSLALLARHALDRNLPPGGLGSPRLRAVFVTGEVLLPHDRQTIERAFGAPVVVEYGCRDGGLLACGCPAGRLHVPEENVIVEVLDPSTGRPVSPGQTGDVVVTNLDCLATPMIRYRTGDLATFGGHGCACGLTSTTLLEVTGRKTDQIVCPTPQGLKHMHALSLIYVLREVEGLRQFRVIQRSLNALDVEIVPGAPFTDQAEKSILQGLRQRVGPQMNIRILRRERITPTASGKHACVISEVKS
ncbi:MAG: AMP-binding protein [Phycisphaerae bacterium]